MVFSRSGRLGRRALLIAGMIALTVGLVIVIVVTKPDPPKPEAVRDNRVKVGVKRVEERDFTRFLTLLGTARALNAAEVSAEVAGNVVWVSPDCEPGVEVEKGTVLIRIDPRPYRIVYDQAQAGLAEANASYALQRITNNIQRERLKESAAQLKVAEVEFGRKKSLVEQGVVSGSEFDNEAADLSSMKNLYLEQRMKIDSAQALLHRAGAKRALAEARKEKAALDLARAEIRAPFTGRITRRLIDPGNMMSVGEAAFRIVDYSTIVVDVEVPSRHAGFVRSGVNVEVAPSGGLAHGSGDGRYRPAELKYLSPGADAGTRLFPGKVYVDSEDVTGILPGQFVNVALTERTPRRALAIPYAAMAQDGTGDYVYLVRENSEHTAEKAYVDVVWTQDSIVIVDGIEPGDLLVVKGHENLAPGARVAVEGNLTGGDAGS